MECSGCQNPDFHSQNHVSKPCNLVSHQWQRLKSIENHNFTYSYHYQKTTALTKNDFTAGCLSHTPPIPSIRIAEPAASQIRSAKPVASPSPCGARGPFWGRSMDVLMCVYQCLEPFSNILRDDDWPIFSRKIISMIVVLSFSVITTTVPKVIHAMILIVQVLFFL